MHRLLRLGLVVATLGLSAEIFAQAASERIILRFGSFDPTFGAPEITPGLRGGKDTNLWIVQFVNKPTESGRAAVARLGGEIHGFLPNSAHVVRMTAAASGAVVQLPEVRWVGHYHPAYRIEPLLLAEHSSDRVIPEHRYNLVVVDKRQDKPELMEAIEALGGTVTHQQPGSLLLEASLTHLQLLATARLDQVLWIERWTPTGRDMDNARVQSGAAHIETVAGYTGQGVRGHVYEGVQFDHPDFTNPPVNVLSCNLASDHGHCAAGILFGNGSSASQARGLAPDLTAFFTNDGCVTPGLSRWQVVEALVNNHEVMLSTASWGHARTTSYSAISADADDIIFDHGLAWTQSQSNAGNQLSRPEAWAKNIFSIGGVHHGDNSDPADDSWQAGNASTGPAEDGRIKPDLCAFYDSIWTSDRTGAAGYDPGDSFASFGGTSGATPIVAGTNALAIQMYTDGLFGPLRVTGGTRFQNRPNFTTLKALQIASATPYAFNSTSSDNRREHQGWGVPNLRAMYEDRSLLHVIDETEALEQGEGVRYEIQVAPGRNSLKAAMTFADPAANPAAALHRVNDLSLRLIAPDGTRYWGNHGLGSGNSSLPGGDADSVDTVECVFIDNPMAGVWKADVVADLVVVDTHAATPEVDADFGLVVRGGNLVGLGLVGSTASFGSGCPGSVLAPPGVCTTINDTANKSPVSLGSGVGYAFEFTAPTALELTGFELYASTVTSNIEQLAAGIYWPDASGAPSILAASTTLTVRPTAPGWSMAPLQSLTVNAGQTFFVFFQAGVYAPLVWQAAAGGTDVPYYALIGGTWGPRNSGPFDWSMRFHCQTSAVRTPGLHSSGTPDIGQSYAVHLEDALPSAFCCILLGASRTSFNGHALPYSLAPLGGGSCTVLVSHQSLLLGTTNAAGAFEASIPLVNNAMFIGSKIYNQGLIVDLAANDLGFVLTNALEVTIGG